MPVIKAVLVISTPSAQLKCLVVSRKAGFFRAGQLKTDRE
jgi:hypothetical protein